MAFNNHLLKACCQAVEMVFLTMYFTTQRVYPILSAEKTKLITLLKTH